MMGNKRLRMMFLNSLRLRIIAACIFFAMAVNIGFVFFLNLTRELSEDTLFNWHITLRAEQLLSLYQQDPQLLENMDINGRYLVGDDQQVLKLLMAGSESHRQDKQLPDTLSQSPLVDDYITITQQGSSIFEFSDGARSVHIVRTPLTTDKASPRYFYYLVDISNFSRSDTDSGWKIALKIAIFAFLTLVLALITGLGVTHFVVAPLTRLEQDLDTIDFSDHSRLTRKYYQDQVGSLANRINALLDRINQLVEREKHITRDASHELRTPITNISMAIELISLLKESQHPKMQQLLMRISRANKNMAHLVSSFLLLGRDESVGEASVSVRLADMVQNSIDKHDYLAKNTSVTAINAVDDQLCIHLPAQLIAILVDNLVRNAYQYTESGFIEISADSDSLEIRDTGPGFNEQSLPQLLKPYQTDHASGLGLGLNIVQRICQYRGWTLTIRNWSDQESDQNNSGASIRITFDEIVRD
ncbi:sensor histidine kinase [Endozoicomonas sp.]|uniref:sensor histidine kinase n=1 Tax=Endozoicomonas sp. TaxID=1892382 RepID=UPI00383AD0EC